MRIIVDLDRVKGQDGAKRFRIRTSYYSSNKDDLRMINAGVDFYNAWKDMIEHVVDPKDTVIVFEGERK